jgi:hypothetical protein
VDKLEGWVTYTGRLVAKLDVDLVGGWVAKLERLVT